MQKVYFASDFHLGIDGRLTSGEREKQIVRWLEYIREDAAAIYLVGDVFDFWFEYTTVVPKGYVRLLGKLAELRDQGIPIYFFTGNHDMWIFRYFEEEMGIPTYRKPIRREIMGKQFLIGHGDGLGPGDYGYKRIKKVFAIQRANGCLSVYIQTLELGWLISGHNAAGQRTTPKKKIFWARIGNG